MTESHSHGGWLVAVIRPGSDRTLYHAAIADPKEAAARVLSVAGEGAADAIGRPSRGRIESLGTQDGEVRFAS